MSVDLEIRIRKYIESQPIGYRANTSSSGDEKAYGCYPVEMILDHERYFRGSLLRNDIPFIPDDPKVDGQKLFKALFSANSPLHDAWIAGEHGETRVRLWIEADDLHHLPWEFLQDDGHIISEDANTPFSRYIPIQLPWGGAVKERPIRVLIVISNPVNLQQKYGLEPIPVDEHMQMLNRVFDAVGPGIVKPVFLEKPVTERRLQEALNHGYHIVHFLAHGTFNEKQGVGALLLEREDGTGSFLKDYKLAEMVRNVQLEERPYLICLGACKSASRSTVDAHRGIVPRLT